MRTPNQSGGVKIIIAGFVGAVMLSFTAIVGLAVFMDSQAANAATSGEITGVNADDVNALANALTIPPMALDAYIVGAGAVRTHFKIEDDTPGCLMRWQLLGANANYESSHGMLNNVAPYFDEQGNTILEIINSQFGAQGVFQFIPGTWKIYSDGYDLDLNNDGEENWNNVYDEALASGLHLCGAEGYDFSTPSGATPEQMTAEFTSYCGGCDGSLRTQWVQAHDQYTLCVVSQIDEPCQSGTSCADAPPSADTGLLSACSIRITQAESFGGAVVINGFACPVVHSETAGPSFVDTFGAPRENGARQHKGVDMMAPLGTPVVAPVSGRVSLRGNSVGGLSFHLYASQPDAEGRMLYYYGTHMSAYADPDGDGTNGETSEVQVEAGTLLGYVGKSGNAASTPPHLHFGIYVNGPDSQYNFPGTSINPTPIVDQYCWNGSRPPLAQAFETPPFA